VASNVFSNDPSGPDSLDNSKHFWPEVSVVFIASALPGFRERLAGVPPCDDVNHSSKSICVICKFPNVLDDLCVWPVFPQDLLRVFVVFTERNSLIAADQLLSSVTETADPGEQVKHPQHEPIPLG
jgi:hypothetical protein